MCLRHGHGRSQHSFTSEQNLSQETSGIVINSNRLSLADQGQ